METLLASIYLIKALNKKELISMRKNVNIEVDLNFDILNFMVSCGTLYFGNNASQAIVLYR